MPPLFLRPFFPFSFAEKGSCYLRCMACQHRFYGMHQPESLLPDWDIDYLFVGTFNPVWVLEGNQQAAYFYGRTQNNYFWKLVAQLWHGDLLPGTGLMHWLRFLQEHRIGITDLILSIEDADFNNVAHQKRIKSMADNDLVQFQQIVWNTDAITKFLEQQPHVRIMVTNLTAPQQMEEQIQSIAAATEDGIIRLRTPSKSARFHLPAPLYQSLFNEWQQALQPILNPAQ